ncbi:MAG TPA: hypothetical protein VH063_11580 [Gaiellaceae bacterium]|jgi:hypothetical protein|nr:hypothetical protein [Gaiellaceae bacterium]
MHRRDIRIAVLPVLAAVVLAAGCGGSKKADPATDWANSLCTAINTWKASVNSTADSLQGGNLSKSSIQSAGNDVQDATNTFVSSLKKLGKPNTQSGDQAKQSVDELSQQIHDGSQKISDEVKGITGVSSAFSAIPVVTSTLQTMGNEISATYTTLKGLDTSGELQTAFDKADSCKSLRSST